MIDNDLDYMVAGLPDQCFKAIHIEIYGVISSDNNQDEISDIDLIHLG
jgi:hypothetical protein